ncbi:hypothetical protein HDU91_004993, partial [Kappamyces sp. JEL0680]
MGTNSTQEAATKALKKEAFSRIYTVSGKVSEAKYLEIPKNGLPRHAHSAEIPPDYYCVGRLDNLVATQFVSQTVANTENPFWADDFKFESKIGFGDVKFLVWGETKVGAETSSFPVGKVVIPRNSLKSTEEQWYMLMDASLDAKVNGSIEVIIKHFPPKMPRKVHGFSVNIIRGRNMTDCTNEQDLPNCYAVLHLLPDPEAVTSQHTHIQLKTNEPTFSETFFFTCQANPEAYKKRIHIALWNQDQTIESGTPTFLGHCCIPLGPVITKKTVHRWYSLRTLEDDADLIQTKKTHKKSSTEDDRRNKTRDFVKALHLSKSGEAIMQREHKLQDKTFALGNCSICNTIMMGVHLYCSECHIGLHQKCQEQSTPTCGGVGAIRLKVEFTKTIVLQQSYYDPVIDILKQDNYQLLILLGKVSSYREDVARCMIRILGLQSAGFVSSVIKQEIMGHDDPKTLFRANSMASKALDVFMKIEGGEYLKATLEDVLKLIVYSKKPFELDPMRWEQNLPNKDKRKKDVPEESAEVNSANLKELNLIVTDCIFQTAAKMPKAMKEIFNMIQSTVEAKWPDQAMVRYTSVSGFIFLRFFAPAILGPALFNLRVGILDAQSSRKLTLIAKTLQNLSNFVEFGQKEPFMEPMNSFIVSRIPDMKKFIDTISLAPRDSSTKKIGQSSAEEIGKDSAELCKMLLGSLDKMSSQTPPSALLPALTEALKTVDQKVKEIEDADQAMPYDISIDSGVDVEQEVAADTQEEKSLLKMLTRFAKSESNPGSPMSPVANYRNSTDMKDLLAKGKVENVQIPVFTFAVNNFANISIPDGSGFGMGPKEGLLAAAMGESLAVDLPGESVHRSSVSSVDITVQRPSTICPPDNDDEFPEDYETPDAENPEVVKKLTSPQESTFGTPTRRRTSLFNTFTSFATGLTNAPPAIADEDEATDSPIAKRSTVNRKPPGRKTSIFNAFLGSNPSPTPAPDLPAFPSAPEDSTHSDESLPEPKIERHMSQSRPESIRARDSTAASTEGSGASSLMSTHS